MVQLLTITSRTTALFSALLLLLLFFIVCLTLMAVKWLLHLRTSHPSSRQEEEGGNKEISPLTRFCLFLWEGKLSAPLYLISQNWITWPPSDQLKDGAEITKQLTPVMPRAFPQAPPQTHWHSIVKERDCRRGRPQGTDRLGHSRPLLI